MLFLFAMLTLRHAAVFMPLLFSHAAAALIIDAYHGHTLLR